MLSTIHSGNLAVDQNESLYLSDFNNIVFFLLGLNICLYFQTSKQYYNNTLNSQLRRNCFIENKMFYEDLR